MRKMLALVSVAAGTAVSAVCAGPVSAAGPVQPHGCPAFGAFMGTAAPSSADGQWPLGQVIRELTPFNDALANHKTYLCG